MAKTKLHKKVLISYCGICCSLCLPYRRKQCPGCLKLKNCKIVQCAKTKKIRHCFLCNEFPCKLYEEGFDWNLNEFEIFKELNLGTVKWKPFSKEYIENFKNCKKVYKKQ